MRLCRGYLGLVHPLCNTSIRDSHLILPLGTRREQRAEVSRREQRSPGECRGLQERAEASRREQRADTSRRDQGSEASRGEQRAETSRKETHTRPRQTPGPDRQSCQLDGTDPEMGLPACVSLSFKDIPPIHALGAGTQSPPLPSPPTPSLLP